MRRASLSEQNETKLDHDPELRGTFDKKNEANGFKSSHGDLALRMEPSNGSFRTAQPPEKDALDEKRSLSILCRRCLDIDIEKLSADGGYGYSLLKTLSKIARTCGLCQLIISSCPRTGRKDFLGGIIGSKLSYASTP